MHLVVSCTNSKTLDVPDLLRFRNVGSSRPAGRLEGWREAVDSCDAQERSAWGLYKGDHWHVVRDLASSGRKVRVWVCSAGYGLVEASDLLKPYAATFTAGHPDSVASDAGGLRKWWSGLSDWRPRGIGGPRSFSQAFAEFSNDRWLVVLSPAYMAAVSEDLTQARGHLKDADLLSIVSSAQTNLNGLSTSLLRVDERFQTMLQGAKLSLNVRVARWIIREAKDLDHQALSDLFLKTLASLTKPPRFERSPMDDAQVVDFIKSQLSVTTKPSATGLLRVFRGQGLACEQSRFSKLYASTLAEVGNV